MNKSKIIFDIKRIISEGSAVSIYKSLHNYLLRRCEIVYSDSSRVIEDQKSTISGLLFYCAIYGMCEELTNSTPEHASFLIVQRLEVGLRDNGMDLQDA